MLRDIVRTACVIVACSVAASLVVETRLRLASIDVAHRACIQMPAASAPTFPQPAAAEPDGPFARLGRATLGWADAALGVVR